jgi:hypothetical protein
MTQPIELRLADDLEKHVGGNIAYRSAAALRRLHSLNQELVEAANLVAAWYAAEDDHSNTTFSERLVMCRNSEDAIKAALAKARGTE